MNCIKQHIRSILWLIILVLGMAVTSMYIKEIAVLSLIGLIVLIVGGRLVLLLIITRWFDSFNKDLKGPDQEWWDRGKKHE